MGHDEKKGVETVSVSMCRGILTTIKRSGLCCSHPLWVQGRDHQNSGQRMQIPGLSSPLPKPASFAPAQAVWALEVGAILCNSPSNLLLGERQTVGRGFCRCHPTCPSPAQIQNPDPEGFSDMRFYFQKRGSPRSQMSSSNP